MPLGEGYPKLKGTKEIGSNIDPRITGDRLEIETDNSGAKATKLREKFYPEL